MRVKLPPLLLLAFRLHRYARAAVAQRPLGGGRVRVRVRVRVRGAVRVGRIRGEMGRSVVGQPSAGPHALAQAPVHGDGEGDGG